MEESDKGLLMTRRGVSGEGFLWFQLTRVVPNKGP